MPRRRGPSAGRTTPKATWSSDQACPRDLCRRHLEEVRGRVTAGAFKTFVALLDLSNPGLGPLWWSVDELGRLRGVHPGTVTRHRAELERAGYIERDVAKSAGPEANWRRWRTTIVRFRHFWRRKKAQVDRRPPRSTAPVSSPPAPTEGPLFQRTHPPPPQDGDSRMAEAEENPFARIRAAHPELVDCSAAPRRRAKEKWTADFFGKHKP